MGIQGNIQQTTSDGFGNTEFNGTDNQERLAFQKGSNQYNIEGEGMNEEGKGGEDEQQKIFSFENEHQNAILQDAQRQQLQT